MHLFIFFLDSPKTKIKFFFKYTVPIEIWCVKLIPPQQLIHHIIKYSFNILVKTAVL